MVQGKHVPLKRCLILKQIRLTRKANMCIIVIEPKNSLDTTAVAAVVTTSTKPLSTLGPEGKHNLRSTRGEFAGESKKSDVIYSRNYPSAFVLWI
jgi:hypothetical protein